MLPDVIDLSGSDPAQSEPLKPFPFTSAAEVAPLV